MFKNIIFTLIAFAGNALGQDIQNGLCDVDFIGIPNFEIKNYVGTWYQVERIDNEYEGSCSRTEYYLVDENTLVLNSTQIVNGELESTLGAARTDESDGTGRLELTFQFLVGETAVEVSALHYILAVDPSSYALLMACDDNDDYSRSVFAWKLSRTRSLTPEATAAINDVIASNSYLSSVIWETTDQSAEACESSTDEVV